MSSEMVTIKDLIVQVATLSGRMDIILSMSTQVTQNKDDIIRLQSNFSNIDEKLNDGKITMNKLADEISANNKSNRNVMIAYGVMMMLAGIFSPIFFQKFFGI